jgi:hypothetical protein
MQVRQDREAEPDEEPWRMRKRAEAAKARPTGGVRHRAHQRATDTAPLNVIGNDERPDLADLRRQWHELGASDDRPGLYGDDELPVLRDDLRPRARKQMTALQVRLDQAVNRIDIAHGRSSKADRRRGLDQGPL